MPVWFGVIWDEIIDSSVNKTFSQQCWKLQDPIIVWTWPWFQGSDAGPCYNSMIAGCFLCAVCFLWWVSGFPPKQSPVCTLKLPWEVEGALRMLEVASTESQAIMAGPLRSHGAHCASSSVVLSMLLVNCLAESVSLRASKAPFQSASASSRAELSKPVLDVRSQPLKKYF